MEIVKEKENTLTALTEIIRSMATVGEKGKTI
jgi:hypothetical protein